jgi:uncharacterized protein
MTSFLRRHVIASLVVSALLFVGTIVTIRPALAVQEKKAAATFEVYQDKGGEYRWRLRAQNAQILATSSEGYKEKRSCLASIDSVKKNAPDAPVEEKPAAE